MQRASLRYVNDGDPGIARQRRGKGFAYRRAGGQLVKRGSDLRRIEAIAIPPAWTDVWICPDPDGHIQATGRDEKGRKQYRYHPLWNKTRGAAKYALMAEFAEALPRLRERVDADLRKRDLSWEKVVATVVWFLDHAMIRVGNDAYTRENGSFGLTTLRARHVEISGASMRFNFRGKSGKDWDIDIADRRMARILRSIDELPGQRLFRYRNEDGGLSDIASHDVNTYIRSVIGEQFSSKDFRTWGGTMRALSLLAETEVPGAPTARSRTLNGVIDKVARWLGNTRAVCRACYIHPTVFSRWEKGELARDLATIRRSRAQRSGLNTEEAAAALWLKRFAERRD